MRIRNLLGAFLGGMLGIFSTQWFLTDWYPAGGIAGGFIGVLLGFYHKEIPVLILRQYRQLQASHLARRQRAEIAAAKQRHRAMARQRLLRKRRQQRVAAVWAMIRAMRDAVNQFNRFVQAMNFAQWQVVIRAAAVGSYLLIHLIISVYLLPVLGIRDPWIALFYMIAAVSMYSTTGTFGSYYDKYEPLKKMAVYYRHYELFSRGWWHLYFWYVGTLFYNQGRALMLTISTLLYGIAGLLASSVVVVPALLAWAAVQAFYVLFRRRAHLPCLAATLITTFIMAVQMRAYMEGAGLFAVALATGIISGVATEVLRGAIKWAVPLRTQARILRFPVRETLVALGRRYWDLGSAVNNRVRAFAPGLREIPAFVKVR